MAFIAAHPIITALVGMEIAGRYQEAKAARDEADYNAEVANRQAEAISQAGKLQEYRIKRRKRLMAGRQRSLYAKAGLVIEGSPLEVLADTAAQYDIDLAASRYNTATGVSNKRYASRYSRYRGKQSMNAGYLKMGGTLLGGYNSMRAYGAGAFGGYAGGYAGARAGF